MSKFTIKPGDRFVVEGSSIATPVTKKWVRDMTKSLRRVHFRSFPANGKTASELARDVVIATAKVHTAGFRMNMETGEVVEVPLRRGWAELAFMFAWQKWGGCRL